MLFVDQMSTTETLKRVLFDDGSSDEWSADTDEVYFLSFKWNALESKGVV